MSTLYNKAIRYGGLPTDHRHFQVWCKLKVTNPDLAYPINLPTTPPYRHRAPILPTTAVTHLLSERSLVI